MSSSVVIAGTGLAMVHHQVAATGLDEPVDAVGGEVADARLQRLDGGTGEPGVEQVPETGQVGGSALSGMIRPTLVAGSTTSRSDEKVASSMATAWTSAYRLTTQKPSS